jgi:hypothetical protein
VAASALPCEIKVALTSDAGSLTSPECRWSGRPGEFKGEDRYVPQLVPPEAPPPVLVGVDDDGRLRRLHFRLWQVTMTAVTVLITGWFVTLGPVMALLALLVAKHVLVAILVQGLGVDAARHSGR